MIKHHLIVGLGLIFSVSTSSFSANLCLKSDKPQNGAPIKLKFSLPTGNSTKGFIRYEKGLSDISVTRISEKSVPTIEATPNTVVGAYDEYHDLRRTGKYFLTTMGGAVVELKYVNLKTKKIYLFGDDTEAYLDGQCSWEKGKASTSVSN